MIVQASADRAGAVQAIKQELVSGGIGFALGVWVDTTGRAKAKVVPIEGVASRRGRRTNVCARQSSQRLGPSTRTCRTWVPRS